jgi:hypothetical protein
MHMAISVACMRAESPAQVPLRDKQTLHETEHADGFNDLQSTEG